MIRIISFFFFIDHVTFISINYNTSLSFVIVIDLKNCDLNNNIFLVTFISINYNISL